MRIRMIREKLGLSRQEVSEILNINEETLARYERGESEPKASFVKEFAEFFKVTIDELFNEPIEEEIEVTVKFYEEDFWEVNDMNLATNTPGAFVVSFGPSSIGIETRGNWKTEDEVCKAFEIAKEKALEVLRVQKGWVKDIGVSLSDEISELDATDKKPFVHRK